MFLSHSSLKYSPQISIVMTSSSVKAGSKPPRRSRYCCLMTPYCSQLSRKTAINIHVASEGVLDPRLRNKQKEPVTIDTNTVIALTKKCQTQCAHPIHSESGWFLSTDCNRDLQSHQFLLKTTVGLPSASFKVKTSPSIWYETAI
jgi:hypothetical protein